MDITHLRDLKPDPRNARRHTPRNTGMIEKALGEVGAARSIVVDEDGVVLAGNATVEAAAAAGIDRVQVVDADGETIIAVRRTGLTPEQKTRLALYDNRTAELAEWDVDVLKGLGDEIDLSGLWGEDELAEVLRIVPNFLPVGEEDQGRLDQKATTTCPECGHVFTP
jgi:ParB-like chromosome segregation protein Spo0J